MSVLVLLFRTKKLRTITEPPDVGLSIDGHGLKDDSSAEEVLPRQLHGTKVSQASRSQGHLQSLTMISGLLQ